MMTQKICKICKTENDSSSELCQHCGSYLGFSTFHKVLIVGLFIWPVLLFAIYLAIKDSIKMKEIREKNNININDLILNQSKTIKIDDTDEKIFKTFCVNPEEHKHREKDGNLTRGEANIKINNNSFSIIQGVENVTYDIDSIYYFGLWEYEDDTYFKFRMRNLNEYKFRSENFEADDISKILKLKGVKIEDDR